MLSALLPPIYLPWQISWQGSQCWYKAHSAGSSLSFHTLNSSISAFCSVFDSALSLVSQELRPLIITAKHSQAQPSTAKLDLDPAQSTTAFVFLQKRLILLHKFAVKDCDKYHEYLQTKCVYFAVLVQGYAKHCITRQNIVQVYKFAFGIRYIAWDS